MVSKKRIIAVLETLKKTEEKSMLEELSVGTPFYILIATALSARNRDEMTIIAVRKLFAKFRTPRQLAYAPLSQIEPLIRLSGFYKTKARRIKEIARIIVEEHKGKVPDTMEGLVALPGVGRKTAGCVLVYGFRKPAIPVDTHVHQIANRLGWVATKNPVQTETALMKLVPDKYWMDVNEAFVIHGRSICVPISPKCSICPIRKFCPRIGVTRSR